jgi:hypothetical protein
MSVAWSSGFQGNTSDLQGVRETDSALWNSLVPRLMLTVLAVVICYQFRWDSVRFLTAELHLRLAALLGMTRERIAPDGVLWGGRVYNYVTACTFADVWCGAIPLLWDLRRPLPSNLARIGMLAIGLLGLNVLRLTLSDGLFTLGVPWLLAHDVIAGLAYFAVWVWLWNHAGWKTEQAT